MHLFIHGYIVGWDFLAQLASYACWKLLVLGEALLESTGLRVDSVFADQVGEYPRMQCFVFKAQSLRNHVSIT